MKKLSLLYHHSILLSVFLITSTISAQWTFPFPTTSPTAPCLNCSPSGWTIASGSTDIATTTSPPSFAYHSATGAIPGNVVPEPSPGITSFLGAATGESVQTTFTIASPQVLTILFGGFGLSLPGGGPDPFAMPAQSEFVLVNGVSQSVSIPWDGQWHPVMYNLPAGTNTIQFSMPATSGSSGSFYGFISIAENQPAPPCSITSPGTIAGTCTGSNNLSFSTTITGSNTGTTYAVTGVPGITPATGTYGTSTTFIIPGGADGSNRNITITDNIDSTCSTTAIISGALPCCNSHADGPTFLGISYRAWFTLLGSTIISLGALGIFYLRKD